MMEIWIDILLALLTIYLAVRCMLAPKLSKTVFIFFAFGLMLALTWIRLNAVDVAIAEAAIASGFMGVLLLDSLQDFLPSFSYHTTSSELEQNPNIKKHYRYRILPMVIFGIGLILFLILLGDAIWNIPQGGGLAVVADANLSESGVKNQITAVLLNFRAYDTWLEIGVILMGLLAIFAAGGFKHFRKASLKVSEDPILRQVILIFIPVLFLFGAFLLYYGKIGPGGAFQAGVLWGAIGIMLHLGGWPVFTDVPRWLRHFLITIGLAFFLLFGLVMVSMGAALFEYPPKYAGFLILVIETLSAISIAAALTSMFAFVTK